MRFRNVFASSYSSSDANYYKFGKSKLCCVLLVIQTMPYEKNDINKSCIFETQYSSLSL